MRWLRIVSGCLCGVVSLQAAGPRSPDEEKAAFYLPHSNLVVELAASEPLVTSPVAMAWDENGFLFVAEMNDYPAGPGQGQVRRLEDKEGDGKYESSIVFAQGISFPNGVLCWNQGLIVTAAPDILWLKDNDGDGKADERKVLYSGFGKGNQQLRVNGLVWGLDNWIYGANGRSDGQVSRPGSTNTVSLTRHDFRFRPGSWEFEVTGGTSQFGQARDDWGNRFLSWNTIPIRHAVIEEGYLSRNPYLQTTNAVWNILESGDSGRVFQRSPPPRIFNTEPPGYFNALAGLTIFRGDALGSEYYGNAFMGESLCNLVHRRILQPHDVTFVAVRGEKNAEFLASSDPWFHPVNFSTGPDGALYIADFYRTFVEHPDWTPAHLKNAVNWRTGAEHGRIWRVRKASGFQRSSRPVMGKMSGTELTKFFEHRNGWWRDTAQRLIVERREKSAVPALRELCKSSRNPLARAHALWTLDGLGALEETLVLSALGDSEPLLQEQAIRLSESHLSNEKIRKQLVSMADHTNARIRLQLALTMGFFPSAERFRCAMVLVKKPGTRWITEAILSSLGQQAGAFLNLLLENDARWMQSPSNEEAELLEQLGSLAAAYRDELQLNSIFQRLQRHQRSSGAFPVFAGIMSRPPIPRYTLGKEFFEQGVAIVESEHPPRIREAALRTLRYAPPELAAEPLLKILTHPEPQAVHSAALRALFGLNEPGLFTKMLENWNLHSVAVHREFLGLVPQSANAMKSLAHAIEEGQVQLSEVDVNTRRRLLETGDAESKNRFASLFKSRQEENRGEIIRKYESAIQMTGDVAQGSAIFATACEQCHTFRGRGTAIAPDLSGISSRGKKALLTDILDPSQQIAPEFIAYRVTPKGEEPVSGILVGETPVSITLRVPSLGDTSFARSEIVEFRAEGKSLMPEGFEANLSVQDLADLLEFLCSAPEEN